MGEVSRLAVWGQGSQGLHRPQSIVSYVESAVIADGLGVNHDWWQGM